MEGVTKITSFECLGVDLDKSGSQAIGDCPFCGKSRHFYVAHDTGLWDCKHCGEFGNFYTFMDKMLAAAQAITTEGDYRKLAAMRGVPWEEFHKAGLAWTGSEWWLPGLSPDGVVLDVRRWWKNDRLMSVPGCALQLWGIEQLAVAPAGTVVWLCEGEWDGIALRWLLEMADVNDVVVAVPGAGTFKKEWLLYFAGKIVYLCYDNDQAGDDGSKKAGDLLAGIARETKYLCWPDTRPKSYDIRDFVKDGRGKELDALEGVELLEKLLSPLHRREVPAKRLSLGRKSTRAEIPATFTEVSGVFGKWVKMDRDMLDAVAICLATTLSTAIDGDPLWFYIIGPPGGGKSLVLMSLSTSDLCLFRSTLTPASLISGFQIKPDPSLIPQMDGKTAIFKDGTELLAMNPDARKEAYGVLRGAFDGHVSKSFGNGVKREYRPHFSLLVGMTPAVHADNQATMGERFLKFEMKENYDTVEDKIRTAVGNISKEAGMQKELTEVVRRFLLNKIDPLRLPEIPEWVIERVIALSQLLSMLRANVERETYGDRDLRYRPGHEVGTRIAKQLVKLGQALTYVFNVVQIDMNIYDILYRVAMDTSIGFHFDITRAVLITGNEGMSKDEIIRATGIPKSTLDKRITDLEQLGILKCKMVTAAGPLRAGPKPNKFYASDRVVDLWQRASGSPIPTKSSLKAAITQLSGARRA